MKYAKYLLLALCLALTACGPKPAASSSASSGPDASLSGSDISRSKPDVSQPDASGSDAPEPDASEPPASLTDADKAAAYDAACDYYLGTVFDVHALTEIGVKEGEITFQVSCSKGGEKVDPDRVISLERKDGVWAVVSEGY